VVQGNGAVGALGNPTNFGATAGQRVGRSAEADAIRAGRYLLRDLLNGVSSLPRCRRCGWRIARGAEGVPIVLSDIVAHFANLQLCGSVWSCPVCAPRIRERRAAEIEQGLGTHLGNGGGAGFLTATVPHDQGDQLAPMLATVRDGFKTMMGSRSWRRDRLEFGIVGAIRSPEITHGVNGWHPHLHGLVLTEKPLVPSDWDTIADRFFIGWSSSVVRGGYRAPTREHGVTLSAVRSATEVAQYTAKFQDGTELRSVGRELTRHDTKQARRHGRAPIAILRDFSETGEKSDLSLWREYEQATKGVSSVRWSRGLKAALGVVDVSDDEIVQEVIVGEILDVLSRPEWRFVKQNRLHTMVLEAAEHPERVQFDQLMAAIREEVAHDGT